MVGTGSFIPENFPDTFATADIYLYEGKPGVKLGREKLFTRPTSIGSEPTVKMIGIVEVARLAASAAGVLAGAKITATCCLTRSAAKSGS